MLGVVNLDKPVGPTSHDMVGLMRRLSGTRRIGHAGTLDPLASGVLPILVGPATRFSDELTGGRKRYDAVIRLGQRSLTDDAEGPILPGAGPLPDRPQIEQALRSFVGTFPQRPPTFSARKQGGQIAHRAARAGAPIDLPPRQVTVTDLRLVEVRPGAGWIGVRIDLRCGAGTFVRSIARDLGELLGCGGHLAALRRTEAAGLRIEDAYAPERLEQLAEDGRLEEAVLPIGALLSLPRVALRPDHANRFRHGGTVRVATGEAGRVAVYAADTLLGIGELHDGVLQPDKVIPAVEA